MYLFENNHIENKPNAYMHYAFDVKCAIWGEEVKGTPNTWFMFFNEIACVCVEI